MALLSEYKTQKKIMQQYVLISVIFYWLRLYNISLVLTPSGLGAASHEIPLCVWGFSEKTDHDCS